MKAACISTCIKLAMSAGVALILSLVFVTGQARAAARDFNIVTNQSSIAVSGTVRRTVGNGNDSTPRHWELDHSIYRNDQNRPHCKWHLVSLRQHDRCKYQRQLEAVGRWIRWFGSGRLRWKSNFLFIVTVNFAGRNLVADLTSGILPIDGSGHFDLSTTNCHIY